jgi:hypothetical protein
MSAGIFSKLFRVNVNFLNDSKEPKQLGISNKPQLISKFKYGRQSNLLVHNANDLGFSGNSFSLQQPLTLGVSRDSRPWMLFGRLASLLQRPRSSSMRHLNSLMLFGRLASF